MADGQLRGEVLFQRHAQNPILRTTDWPYLVDSVFNPGAALLPDGTTVLLCRAEDRRGISHLTVARSPNGVDGWVVDPQPTFAPQPDRYPEETWGVEDPRVTYLAEREQYAIAYTAYSRSGPGISLALTRDFRTFERWGTIIGPIAKDAALVPHRIGGCWALVHRPTRHAGRRTGGWFIRRPDDAPDAHIWVSFSDDLRHWDDHLQILTAREGPWWDSHKIGLTAPLIETPEGWLMIYHGVRQTDAGNIYRCGLALFDSDMRRCRLRGDTWVLGPQELYERVGDVPNVVFPCGYTLAPDGDTLALYYGAADTAIGLATGSVRALLEWLQRHGQPSVPANP